MYSIFFFAQRTKLSTVDNYTDFMFKVINNYKLLKIKKH